MDHWLSFVIKLGFTNDYSSAVSKLEKTLRSVTYLVGHQLTVADIAVWGFLRGLYFTIYYFSNNSLGLF